MDPEKNGLAEQNPAKVLAVTAVSSKKVPVVKGPRELPELLKSSSLAFYLDKTSSSSDLRFLSFLWTTESRVSSVSVVKQLCYFLNEVGVGRALR